jgi:aryl-alcohol dehydrogenase-like predicted oxidoreductase
MERIPFGRTGHESSRMIFGAAALGAMRQEKADGVLELLLEFGVNHLDTAARYGDSELRIGPWMERYRDRFFLATKTGDRSGEGARASLEHSRARLRSDVIDLIQLHNLVDEAGWEEAFAPGGAVAALAEAKQRGEVRFLGVTGHGTQAAAMHLRSLERFPFDSVLLPYNFTMLAQPEYRADLEALFTVCTERGVAVQTIKSIARRRWPEDSGGRRFAWYEPIQEPEAIRRAVHFVLARPGIFLNTSSDATLLRVSLEAAEERIEAPSSALLEQDVSRLGIAPLFVRGVSDTI